jgi:vacuolar iron transporter family protein
MSSLADSPAREPGPRSQAIAEAVDRLLQAWRGEVEAGAVYRVLAERERDPRRADVLLRMAEAEAVHLRRIEERLRRLGAEPPEASVRVPRWTLLQARVAPLGRVLATREAAESAEVGDRYLRPTGDAETDRLLAGIRDEEAGHARQVAALRRGDAPEPPAAAVRLDRILSRESWHRSGSGWISAAIYGFNDGLAAVFGIVAGVSGATGGSSFVLTAGLAGAVASALSMATGAFLAARSEAEVAAANLDRERREIEEHPEEEIEELSLFLQLRGLEQADADDLARRLSANPEAMLQLMATEELGGGAVAPGRPAQAALAAGVSTGIGAMIPVLPFFWLLGWPGVVVAGAISLIAHFGVGAAKSLVTLRSWWASGLEMTAAGVVVGAATYAVGLLF